MAEQKQIDVAKLIPGMYVEGVAKQNGSYKVATQGWVRTQEAINQLVKAGIKSVYIDPDKFLQSETQASELSDAAVSEAPQATPRCVTKSLASELDKAQILYTEAKNLQSRAFSEIKAGKPIDIEPFKHVADGFIDSVFRNQDALACLASIREKDAYLLEHSVNVSILMTIFAKHLGYDRETIHVLATGALLHDIGKIKIDDAILNKPGKLTNDEYQLIQHHPQFSQEILLQSGVEQLAVDIAFSHHERLDGKGYPQGLSGDELTEPMRMIAIVDVYDALTANRVYKESQPAITAFKVIRNDTPNGFDKRLVDEFIRCIGVYPVGTLVKLKSQRLGMITKLNPSNPLTPHVKLFYNVKHKHYTEVKDIDLADKKVDDEIETAIRPEQFGIELLKFFKAAFSTN